MKKLNNKNCLPRHPKYCQADNETRTKSKLIRRIKRTCVWLTAKKSTKPFTWEEEEIRRAWREFEYKIKAVRCKLKYGSV